MLGVKIKKGRQNKNFERYKELKLSNPLVTIVMSVYNSEKYLAEAIESILNQTYTSFEFIIVNDGSTDNSFDIIEEFMKRDGRIVLINRENMGLPYSLNEGIFWAKGKYIARMDADDISLPTRLEDQVRFMEENNLDICGTNIQLFNENNTYKILDYPKNDISVKFILMFMSSFAHPSVIMKKNIFQKVKYQNFVTSQDYRLWCDIAINDYKMGNINKVLLKYRYHSNQISKKNNSLQREKTFEISEYYLKQIGQEKILNNLNKIRNGVTPIVLKVLYDEIDNYRKKSNIDDKLFLEVARYILKISSPNSFKLFLVYRNATTNINKDFKIEFYLLIQSLFSINRESKLYQYLKRFV